MSTQLQKNLVKEIISDIGNAKPLTGEKLLVKAGYSKNISKQSGRVIKQKGVQEELKNLGFTEEGADSVVKEILYNKKEKANDRLNAADKIYKRLSSYAPEKHDIRELKIEISEVIALKNDVTNPIPDNHS